MDGSFDPCSSNEREGETLIERETTFSGRASRLRDGDACDLLSPVRKGWGRGRGGDLVDRETRNAMGRALSH